MVLGLTWLMRLMETLMAHSKKGHFGITLIGPDILKIRARKSMRNQQTGNHSKNRNRSYHVSIDQQNNTSGRAFNLEQLDQLYKMLSDINKPGQSSSSTLMTHKGNYSSVLVTIII